MITVIAYLIFAITFWAWRYSLDINDRRRPHKPDRKRPITILKPIKGDQDPCFISNIFSFMEQDWFDGDELIFCFESENDPAVKIISEIMDFYPGVPARICVGYASGGVNPKIKTIYKGYHQTKNDLVLISDSNVRVPYNYLNLVDYEHFDDVGVLTAAIIGSECWSFWAKVEAMLMQKFYNKWLLIANNAGQSIVMGKSMAFSRRQLESLGGLEAAIQYLAEDYRIGDLISAGLGMPTKIMSIPVYTPLGNRTMKDVFDRYVRWGRMRKSQAPWAFFLEIFSSMSFVSLLLIMKPWWVNMCIMTMWGFFECKMIERITGRRPYFIPYLMSEWITFPIWLITTFSSKVVWRGRTFKMLSGGQCTELD